MSDTDPLLKQTRASGITVHVVVPAVLLQRIDQVSAEYTGRSETIRDLLRLGLEARRRPATARSD
jgi:metal-responsive CopG/Arc/MetJ family transcriptional regulator